ncbi:hypothetical protein [Kitasatospora mediocidica]|nr:hypothetical protein [Kitasatospora mediocidica]
MSALVSTMIRDLRRRLARQAKPARTRKPDLWEQVLMPQSRWSS